MFYRSCHVPFCSWDISHRTNRKAYVNLARWPGSKCTVLHLLCGASVFTLESTKSFKEGFLCVRRINCQRQSLEITRDGPCLGAPSWICSHVMTHSKLLLCQAVLLLLLLWLQCCSLSQRLVTDKDTCSMSLSPDIHHPISWSAPFCPHHTLKWHSPEL